MIISNGGYVKSPLQKTGLTLMTDGMSRSRKKFPEELYVDVNLRKEASRSHPSVSAGVSGY